MVFTSRSDGHVERVREYLRENLSHARYLHSELTASLAASLCIRFGCDQEEGFLAGLAHDIARELPGQEILRIVGGAGRTLSADETDRPVLAHGTAGEILLRERFDIAVPAVLEAVRCHTLGFPGMGRLAKIVFCADALEYGRTDVRTAWRESVLGKDLDGMTGAVIEATWQYLLSRGRIPAAQTMELYRELCGA